MSLGKTIAKFRKERGFTQVELAEKLGVHQSHITRWESDRVRPRQQTLTKLAECLDSSVEELLVGGKGPGLLVQHRRPRVGGTAVR